jgi:hypothetical protein
MTHDVGCGSLIRIGSSTGKDFPADVLDQARRILNPSQEDRVLRAVLTLSEGDLERLRYYAEVAETDYRDVLYWAETPRQPEAPRSYEELRERLNLPPEA